MIAEAPKATVDERLQPPFASVVLQQPNPNPNLNPFGYVQLGNLKKPKNKRYCHSFYSATKKSRPFWVAPKNTVENFAP